MTGAVKENTSMSASEWLVIQDFEKRKPPFLTSLGPDGAGPSIFQRHLILVPGSAPALGCRRVRLAPDLLKFQRPSADFSKPPREAQGGTPEAGVPLRDLFRRCVL